MHMLKELSGLCRIENDRLGCRDARILSFVFDQRALVTARVKFKDSCGADLVIATLTTLPEEEKRKGYGRKAMAIILNLALKQGLRNIRAVQVQENSTGFWEEIGFVPLGNESNDFVYQIPSTDGSPSHE